MTAARFLGMLGGRHTLQTFDDSSNKERALSRILHGSLDEHADSLADLNSRGAGVFVMINEGDGLGRKARNVLRVRALFVDLDGAPLEAVRAAPLPAHCIVESSPDRWHAYWRVTDCPRERFRELQKALAARFSGDAKVCDLPRVMRLPGFDHHKRRPFRVRIVTMEDRAPYSLAELEKAFDLGLPAALQPTAKSKLPDVIPEGRRNETLFDLGAALARQGHDARAINCRLQRINTERCSPPLCASEVEGIAAHAAGYRSDGYTALPHKLLDSSEWKGLPPPAHDVILTAFRRFNGRNNGNIALTYADFQGRPGFGDDKTFYRHRAAAVDSGILIKAARGKHTRNGITPTLFAINPRFLHESHTGKMPVGARPQNAPSYIDKQDRGTMLSQASPNHTNSARGSFRRHRAHARA